MEGTQPEGSGGGWNGGMGNQQDQWMDGGRMEPECVEGAADGQCPGSMALVALRQLMSVI